MFQIEQTACRVTSVSTNSENQGNSGETKLGMSIYVEYQASNEELDKFDTKLRPSLYEAASNNQQGDLTGFLPAPKFKLAKPICWPYVGAGYGAVIHPEFEVNEEFEIEDVKVDKFQFAINDEGVVGFKFRLYLHPTLEQVGPLCALEKHEVKLSLVPPKISDTGTAASDEEESPQTDMLADVEKAETDVLYPKAVAIVRATKNPNTQALMTELRCSINDAARMLQRMVDEGVIVLKGDEYVFAEAAA